jgi:hypothetical protein
MRLTLINGTLGKPLTYLGGSIGGLVVVKIFEQFLWFFGLHGGSIIQAVMDPIHQVLEDQNKVASLAGAIPPNIISMSFRNHFASIGVVGAVIAILIVAKSRQYKEVGKISSVPYMFNIGEPALFGIPLMLNFLYFIPFIFSNAISTVIAYVVFALGLSAASDRFGADSMDNATDHQRILRDRQHQRVTSADCPDRNHNNCLDSFRTDGRQRTVQRGKRNGQHRFGFGCPGSRRNPLNA